MELVGVHPVVAPTLTVETLAFTFLGVCLGAATGLTPGIHVNNAAMLIAALLPVLPGPPRLVGVTLLAAGIVHSFLDVIPAIALGVPDPAMAVNALPGHRLVIEGRGREALRLSALGSGLAVVFAIPLAVPMTTAMTDVYPLVRSHLPLVLGGVVAFLLATEPSTRGRLGGALTMCIAGALGLVTLDLPVRGVLPVGGPLTPLFAGLFGAPVLLEAIGGTGVPSQSDAQITLSRRLAIVTALGGSVAGAIVGFLPGVSSAIAAVIALAFVPGSSGARGFVVATSGVNTANTVFALAALVVLGTPRTGVMVALDGTGAPLDVPLLVAGGAIAACCGFVLVLLVGDDYLRWVSRLDHTRLSVGVLGLLLAASFAFGGPLGVGIFAVSALVGTVPTRFGARRVHLMGVLIVPLVLAG